MSKYPDTKILLLFWPTIQYHLMSQIHDAVLLKCYWYWWQTSLVHRNAAKVKSHNSDDQNTSTWQIVHIITSVACCKTMKLQLMVLAKWLCEPLSIHVNFMKHFALATWITNCLVIALLFIIHMFANKPHLKHHLCQRLNALLMCFSPLVHISVR